MQPVVSSTESLRGRRVLLSVGGSGGDLFQLLPLAFELRAAGTHVRFAVTRQLGVAVRMAGFSVVLLGDGRESEAFIDPRLRTTACNGWASLRHALARYTAPTLADDIRRLRDAVESWAPDAIVSGRLATAARLAAYQSDVPSVAVSTWPLHDARLAHTRAFGASVRNAAAHVLGCDPRDSLVAEVLWGRAADVLLWLHEPALIGQRSVGGGDVVGYPYWDAAPSLPGDAERAVAFAAESDDPLVIVTFGSFLGRGSADAWETVARGLLDLPVSVLLMGPKDDQVNELHAANDRMTSVGYVPLSLVGASASCVVHHGGLGTSIGSLACGVPAVILPFGFDQPTNAALVARAGAGRVSPSPDTVATDVRALLADDTALTAAQSLSERIVDSATATRSVLVAVAGVVAGKG